ncbi:hypothetical protein B0H19DRAFT_1252781 [Mycena capillaripes]|nr:hypothetical protein B0H19DRAFT_1252781 [Mycena capillaripes]
MTILVFDYLLSMHLEVSLVWGSKWSFSKVFYLCSRYPPFLDVPLQLWYSLTPNINIDMCKPIYSAASWGTCIGIAMAEALLLLRTYALMGCNFRALVALVIQYVAILCTTIVVLTMFLKSLRFGPPPLTVAGCYLVDGNTIVVVAFILVVFNETVLMICTLWVGITRFRHSHNHLIKILYRDGITYFILLFCISVANLATLIWGPLELVDLFNTFLRVMHSVLSTRIVLHDLTHQMPLEISSDIRALSSRFRCSDTEPTGCADDILEHMPFIGIYRAVSARFKFVEWTNIQIAFPRAVDFDQFLSRAGNQGTSISLHGVLQPAVGAVVQQHAQRV